MLKKTIILHIPYFPISIIYLYSPFPFPFPKKSVGDRYSGFCRRPYTFFPSRIRAVIFCVDHWFCTLWLRCCRATFVTSNICFFYVFLLRYVFMFIGGESFCGWVSTFFFVSFYFCFCIFCPFIYLCVCLYVSSRCVGVFFCTFACVCMSVCANANHISMWIFIVPLRYLKRERIHVRTPYQRKRRNILDSVERNAI